MATSDKAIQDAIEKAGSINGAAKLLGLSRSTVRVRLGKLKQAEELDMQGEHALRIENRRLRERLAEALSDNHEAKAFNELIASIENRKLQPPKWLAPKRKGKGESAIACAMLSDCHFDEVVFPEQIGFVNAYNRDIAKARLRRFFENVVRLSRDYIKGVNVDGFALCLGGDLLSGQIHPELVETNEGRLLEGVFIWADELAAGIKMLADHFGRLYICGVVGNHGRMTLKPRSKFRAWDNFDWLLYRMLERQFIDDKRISFEIPASADHRFDVYSTRFLLTHGDQFRGGTGISGMMSAIMLGDARKRKAYNASGDPYDIMLLGHWHNLTLGVKSVMVNGSLKGFDEYSRTSNFDFELPQQAFWIVDPQWGVTLRAPVHVSEPSESWAQPEKARPRAYQVG